jgi:hypothetical protein
MATKTGTECPPSLRQAVDVLVERHGVAGAELELQERFGPRSNRSIAALAYLRREHGRARAAETARRDEGGGGGRS